MSHEYGYAGKVLRVDLTEGRTWSTPTRDYAGFIGGRGFAAKVHWDEVAPGVGALDPENRLTFFTGPLTGFAGIGSPRWQVCAKSPSSTPEHFSYCNLGGSWGVALKYAGYDGVVVQGRADRPVYLLVKEGGAEVRDARHLWGRGAIDAREMLKSELGADVCVAACGQAGENQVLGASITADLDSSGGGGLGTVMGSKRLKAIAVAKGAHKLAAADPARLTELVKYFKWIQGPPDLQGESRYEFSEAGKVSKELCRGCPGPCQRKSYRADDGREGKLFCQSAMLYQTRAANFYGKGKDGDVAFHVTKMCDNYGVDTRTAHLWMTWLPRLFRAGLLTEEQAGIPLSKVGSYEFAEALLRTLSLREGLGEVMARGIEKAADHFGKGSMDHLGDTYIKAQQDEIYGGRVYYVNALMFAMDARNPIMLLHEASRPVERWAMWHRGVEGAFLSGQVLEGIGKAFFGSAAATDYSTYEGKALAAKMVHDREYAKESLILCDFQYPVFYSPNTPDHVGDPTFESQLYSAVTGRETDHEGLDRLGERIFTLQRAIHAREGHAGRESDSLPDFVFNTPIKAMFINPELLVPGPGGRPVAMKGNVLDRQKFEEMKSEYYRLRGWDVATGRLTRRKLEELGLGEVAGTLETEGRLA